MGENKIRIVYTYPNQKVVTTHKAESNKENIYGILNIEALHQASKVMNDKEFRLYVYMSCQQDGYTYGLSPKAIKERIGLSEDRCRAAVNGLIDKGYLKKQTDGSNLYDFFENPAGIINIQSSNISKRDKSPYIKRENNTPKTSREILQDSTYNTADIRLNNYSDTTTAEHWIDRCWRQIETEQPKYRDILNKNSADKEPLPF